MQDTRPDGITAMGAVDLAAAIRGRVVSCAEVMRAYLERIHRLNPQVNAIVAMADDAALLRRPRPPMPPWRAAIPSARCTASRWP